MKLTLYVEEDGLLPDTVVIDSSDNVFATIFQLDSINDECEVISCVSLHELDALLKLAVVVRPTNGRWRHGDDATVEFGALSLIGESGLWPDDEARSCLASVKGILVDAVSLNQQFAEAAVLGESSDGHQVVFPARIFGAKPVAHGKVAGRRDGDGQLAVITQEPWVK